MTGVLDEAKRVADRAGRQLAHTAKDVSVWVDHAGSDVKTGKWLKFAGVAALGFAAGVGFLSARKLGMQTATAVAGDWFAQLKAEHRLAETLFEAGLKTKDRETAKRTGILAHLAYALTKHALQEEAVIYPALRKSGEEAEAKGLAAEHFDIKTYLDELARTPKDDPAWIVAWGRLYELVKRHVKEEEETIFPAFHRQNAPAENARLTAAMNREGVKLA